jgi:hypothetical protein
VVVAAEIELVTVAEAQRMVLLIEAVVVLPQRELRVLPVPEDELVFRHRRSPRRPAKNAALSSE